LCGIFDKQDKGKKGYHDRPESKKFFEIILDLKLDTEDIRIFDHIMTIVDPEETGNCTLEAMLALCNKPDLFDLIKPPVQE
jgi:hypothetical protein